MVEEKNRNRVMENLTNDLICPISGEIFKDPVIASDGFTYEREMIEKWLEWNDTSPLTNMQLINFELFPNLTVKKLVSDFLELEKTENKHVILELENIDVNNKSHRNNMFKDNFIDDFVNKKNIFETRNNIQNFENNKYKKTNNLNEDSKILKEFKECVNKFGINYVNQKKITLFEIFLKKNLNEKSLLFIMNEYMKVNPEDYEYVSKDNKFKLIHLVCKYCTVNCLKKLVFAEYDLENKTQNGWKPIHFLCKYGTIDSLIYLLKKGVNINDATNLGYMPFDIVCRHGNVSKIKCIVLHRNFKYDARTTKTLLAENKNLSKYDLEEIKKFIVENKK